MKDANKHRKQSQCFLFSSSFKSRLLSCLAFSYFRALQLANKLRNAQATKCNANCAQVKRAQTALTRHWPSRAVSLSSTAHSDLATRVSHFRARFLSLRLSTCITARLEGECCEASLALIELKLANCADSRIARQSKQRTTAQTKLKFQCRIKWFESENIFHFQICKSFLARFKNWCNFWVEASTEHFTLHELAF